MGDARRGFLAGVAAVVMALVAITGTPQPASAGEGPDVVACVYVGGAYVVVDDMKQDELDATYGSSNYWLWGSPGFEFCGDVLGANAVACVETGGGYQVVDDLTEEELIALYGADKVWLQGTPGFDLCGMLPDTGAGHMLFSLALGTIALASGLRLVIVAGRRRDRDGLTGLA